MGCVYCVDQVDSASEVQMACRAHAQRIGEPSLRDPYSCLAKGTLFADVTRIEAIQAMSEFHSLQSKIDLSVILATFTDRGWLPGGHAIRMGLDMGLDQAFSQLLRSGMGFGSESFGIGIRAHPCRSSEGVVLRE